MQSALIRIRKAQKKGKQDVKLSKEELKALERRRKRLEEEEELKKRRDSTGSEQRRRKERVAVPLSQFGPPVSRKAKSSASKSDDVLSRHPSPVTVNSNHDRTPPMGLFPPPNAARSRPRSSTSSSQRYSPAQGSSPFEYNYVHSSSSQRHLSDSPARSSPSRLPYPPDDGDWRPNSSSSRELRDPFQYQTAGPRAPYVSGAAAARRNLSGGNTHGNAPRGTVPAAARNNGSSEETSSQDGSTTSDDLGNGAHISRSRTGTPDVGPIIIEESPEPERPKSKRSSSRASPVKRKPVSGNSGGRRRKK